MNIILKNKKLSWYVFTASILSFVVFGCIITILLFYRIDTTLKRTQSIQRLRESKGIVSDITQYLTTRSSLIKDYAQYPVLIQSCMQPSLNRGNLHDFLSATKVFNKSVNYAFLDFKGDALFNNTTLSENQFKEMPWVKNILNDTLTSFIHLYKTDTGYFWGLLSAVQYNGHTECILSAEFPLQSILEIPHFKNVSGIQISVLYKDNQALSFGTKSNGIAFWTSLSYPHTKVRIISDIQDYIDTRNSLIIEILCILAFLSLVLFGLFYRISQKHLIKPIATLQKITTDLAAGFSPTHPVYEKSIQELQDLYDNFIAMSDIILDRENELIKHNTTLETTLQQLKSAQTQLIQQEKLASIGQLAAGIAHEINNPVGYVTSNISTLNTYLEKIIHYIDTLEKETQPSTDSHKSEKGNISFILDDTHDLVSECQSGLKRITTIVKNLKNFSHIDTSNTFDNFDIVAGIKSTLVVAKNEYKYFIDIIEHYTDQPIIKANGSELNQVFLNLIVNASQAVRDSDKEKGSLTITVEEHQSEIHCIFTDNGPGIPKEVEPKIFDPFFTTKEVGEGTGLGLNISYDIITNRHKGTIGVTTELGKGSTFTVKIPKNSPEM
ncbi:MAG: HAMP domain-containing histidine kinase [Fibrobacterales bacterium]